MFKKLTLILLVIGLLQAANRKPGLYLTSVPYIGGDLNKDAQNIIIRPGDNLYATWVTKKPIGEYLDSYKDGKIRTLSIEVRPNQSTFNGVELIEDVLIKKIVIKVSETELGENRIDLNKNYLTFPLMAPENQYNYVNKTKKWDREFANSAYNADSDEQGRHISFTSYAFSKFLLDHISQALYEKENAVQFNYKITIGSSEQKESAEMKVEWGRRTDLANLWLKHMEYALKVEESTVLPETIDLQEHEENLLKKDLQQFLVAFYPNDRLIVNSVKMNKGGLSSRQSEDWLYEKDYNNKATKRYGYLQTYVTDEITSQCLVYFFKVKQEVNSENYFETTKIDFIRLPHSEDVFGERVTKYEKRFAYRWYPISCAKR